MLLSNFSNCSTHTVCHQNLRRGTWMSAWSRFASRNCWAWSGCCLPVSIIMQWGFPWCWCTGPEVSWVDLSCRCHMPFTSTASRSLLFCFLIEASAFKWKDSHNELLLLNKTMLKHLWLRRGGGWGGGLTTNKTKEWEIKQRFPHWLPCMGL